MPDFKFRFFVWCRGNAYEEKKTVKRQKNLPPLNGLLPCAAMFPTVGSRWSGTMATTVMSAGAIGKNKSLI